MLSGVPRPPQGKRCPQDTLPTRASPSDPWQINQGLASLETKRMSAQSFSNCLYIRHLQTLLQKSTTPQPDTHFPKPVQGVGVRPPQAQESSATVSTDSPTKASSATTITTTDSTQATSATPEPMSTALPGLPTLPPRPEGNWWQWWRESQLID